MAGFTPCPGSAKKAHCWVKAPDGTKTCSACGMSFSKVMSEYVTEYRKARMATDAKWAAKVRAADRKRSKKNFKAKYSKDPFWTERKKETSREAMKRMKDRLRNSPRDEQ